MPITVGEAGHGGIGRSAEGPGADADLMAEARARARGRGWSRILTRTSGHQENAIQRSKFVVGVVGGATAVVALGGLGTYLLAGTESTSGLDDHSTASVGGHRALAAWVVAGRTESKFHPLPWVGEKLSGIACPTALKAVAGASITCTGKKGDGEVVRIPVRVTKADANSVTWKFER